MSSVSIIPVTKESLCYIVAVILFNDAGQVLLVQEAKRQCYGMWYLPAGRLERNENFVVSVWLVCLIPTVEETGISKIVFFVCVD